MGRQAELAPQSYFELKKKKSWKDYIEITKPGININNTLVALAGYLLAAGFTSSFAPGLLVLTLVGTALIIAGSCVLNNFYDRDIDQYMERTKLRPIPDGRIAPVTALWYGIILLSLGVLVLALGMNLLAALLGLVGSIAYVVIYTMWLKRNSTLNTIVGGFSGAVPPLIGWVAITGSLDLAAWALFLILFLWQPPHFYALAILKADDYRAAGIPMLPVKKGNTATKKQTFVFTLLLLPSSILLFYSGAVGWIYMGSTLILTLVYIILAWKGFYTNQDLQWARQMFLYSLFYLVAILSVIMIDVAFTRTTFF